MSIGFLVTLPEQIGRFEPLVRRMPGARFLLPRGRWPSPWLDSRAWTARILAGFIRTELKRTGRSRLVLGLSGGIDSALSAYLGVRAIGPDGVVAVLMPYRTSSPDSLTDADRVYPGDGTRPVSEIIQLLAANDTPVALSTSLPRALEGISVTETAGGAVTVAADELIIANISVPPGETVVVIEGVVRADLLDGAVIAPTITLRPDHGALATLETPLTLTVNTEGVE